LIQYLSSREEEEEEEEGQGEHSGENISFSKKYKKNERMRLSKCSQEDGISRNTGSGTIE